MTLRHYLLQFHLGLIAFTLASFHFRWAGLLFEEKEVEEMLRTYRERQRSTLPVFRDMLCSQTLALGSGNL